MPDTNAKIRWVKSKTMTLFQKYIMTPILLQQKQQLTDRKLEIGPGGSRIPGFETVDIIGGYNVDYVLDASQPLPFKDDTFQIVYASHILEHIPWYKILDVLKEWTRILRPKGHLEIWVPNGLKICKAFVNGEIAESDAFKQDNWYRFNKDKDVCIWASGRIFTYGDGSGCTNHPNWHRAIFSPRYLHKLFNQAGLKSIRELEAEEVRGYDHGWINLGVTGVKP